MNDTKTPGDKTLSVAPKKTFGLKRPGTDTVRQSFSHGRTNTVEVVVKKPRRLVVPGESPTARAAPSSAPSAPPAAAAATTTTTPAAAPRPQQEARPSQPPRREGSPSGQQPRRDGSPSSQQPRRDGGSPSSAQPRRDGAPQRPSGRPGTMVLKTLSSDEMEARTRALADSKVREAEERRQAQIDAVRRAEEDARLSRERAEAERRQTEEDARRRVEAEARQRAEEISRRRLGEEERAAPAATEAPVRGRPGPTREAGGGDEDRSGARGRVKTARPGVPDTKAAPAAKKATPAEERARRGRLTLTNALDDSERERSLASRRRLQEKRMKGRQQEGPREKVSREVILPETITLQELASRMAVRAADVIMMLMKQGQLLKINDVIDADMAQIIAEDFGHTVKRVSEADVETGLFDAGDTEGDLVSRPPVVTIMGHVDHGKTSLLDAIRKTNVVSGEAGGITQHIGAYQVESNGQKITFIDTPGHAAFTAMRARGAKVTDIVVLVVAADDGVMPQTIEAINHAKAAKVPMIVAINKIDKPDGNPARVRTELLQHEVFVESMGGEVLDVEVSALKGTNLDKLLETIVLQSEVMELKANPNRPAEGSVVEAKLDRGRGTVATVLVQRGTLRQGDIVVAGSEWGRVRALVNDRGETVASAGPSSPVEVLGFQAAPEAGDRIAVVDNEARAREIADYRHRQKREKAQARMTGERGSLEQMMNQLQTTGRKEFPLVIKGDVQGSIEAIAGALNNLGTAEVGARVIHSGVGGITESDVQLAAASNAAIIGFNVRANKQARDASEQAGIEIRYYNIIYNLVDDVKAAMSGLLSPERRETMLGNAEILEVFNISKVGKVAGCRVTDGVVQRGANVRLIRDNVVIHDGKLSTLKRFKDEVREVPAGQECGMAFEKYEDMRAGDVIECYRVEEIQRSL